MDSGLTWIAIIIALGLLAAVGVIIVLSVARGSSKLPRCPQCNRPLQPGVEACSNCGMKFK
jgi:flagellar basal body-associated protein FliL